MTKISQFIVVEGGEGAGKSRLVAALGERLATRRREVVVTREPGGTPLGEEIRALVLRDMAVGSHLAELLLFEAARAHLVATVIEPALARGAIVLCDRFAASSLAYQGYGRGLGREIVEDANTIAAGTLTPDVTLLLDLPVDVGLARRAGAGTANHFDRETVAFHQRVRVGFLELARESPHSWRVIDATQPFEVVVAAAVAAVT